MNSSSRNSRVRSLRQRGAAAVEYVMLVSLFSVTVSVAATSMQTHVEQDSAETATQIGGIPGASTTEVTTTSVGGTTTTMPNNNAPVVYAGPDVTVYPGTTLTQPGTFSDSNTPADLLDIAWSVSGGSLSNQTRTGGNTTINFSNTRPGTYTLRLTASDGFLEGSDTAQIKVTSGIVRVSSLDTYGWWEDYRLLKWHAETRVDIRNEFGRKTPGITIWGTWTFSNGSTTSQSCVADGNARCYFRAYNLSPSITSARFEVTNMTGPAGCFDGWDGNNQEDSQSQGGLWVPPPPTTTASTTTASTTSTASTTTTTRPTTTTAATTTTHATTTTRTTIPL